MTTQRDLFNEPHITIKDNQVLWMRFLFTISTIGAIAGLILFILILANGVRL